MDPTPRYKESPAPQPQTTSFAKTAFALCAQNSGHHMSTTVYLDLYHTLYHSLLFLKLYSPAVQTLLGAGTYHVENAGCLDGLESGDGNAVVSVAVAEAAALHDEVVDGVVQGRWGLQGPGGRVCREAGAALPLQQPHTQVGDLQLCLGFRAVWVLRSVRR